MNATLTAFEQTPDSVVDRGKLAFVAAMLVVGLLHVPVRSPAYRQLPTAVAASTLRFLTVVSPFTCDTATGSLAVFSSVALNITPVHDEAVACTIVPLAPPDTLLMLPVTPVREQFVDPNGVLIDSEPMTSVKAYGFGVTEALAAAAIVQHDNTASVLAISALLARFICVLSSMRAAADGE